LRTLGYENGIKLQKETDYDTRTVLEGEKRMTAEEAGIGAKNHHRKIIACSEPDAIELGRVEGSIRDPRHPARQRPRKEEMEEGGGEKEAAAERHRTLLSDQDGGRSDQVPLGGGKKE